MHPAYSVIVFTTSSGAGYGLLALLGIWGMSGRPAPGIGFGIVAGGLAFLLITVGLVASTYHLGRPERAWRAFSQWRSSWLSREGVAAAASYPVGGLFLLAWIFPETVPLPIPALGAVTVVACIVTTVCTAMIYNSLVTIRQWRHPLVVPIYLVIALATGATLLMALCGVFGLPARSPVSVAAVLGCALAIGIVYAYWSACDADKGRLTAGRATGLSRLGEVRQWEVPHTAGNFVTMEMGYRVARDHAMRLRQGVLAGTGLAMLCALLSLTLPGALGVVPALVAVPLLGAAALVQRWLFFAQAEHVVSLFYGAARA